MRPVPCVSGVPKKPFLRSARRLGPIPTHPVCGTKSTFLGSDLNSDRALWLPTEIHGTGRGTYRVPRFMPRCAAAAPAPGPSGVGLLHVAVVADARSRVVESVPIDVAWRNISETKARARWPG
jgi:hypothetical protein